MPKLPLPPNLPLKVRGIKGVISIISITPLAPLILRGVIMLSNREGKDSFTPQKSPRKKRWY